MIRTAVKVQFEFRIFMQTRYRMEKLKLFMVILGCTPKGRLTEQHDIFFGIGHTLKDLIPAMKAFWPGTVLHIDAWREVTSVDGNRISVVPSDGNPSGTQLFFVNLGGYRPGEFEEYHYKILSVGTMPEAVKKSRQTAFYKHFGFKGAESHVDDKFGIDVDDLFDVGDLFRGRYALAIHPEPGIADDELHIGYIRIEKLLKA